MSNCYTGNTEPLVSVVVPLYNIRIDYFKQCLLHLVGQSYANFEAIIIDDGSDESNSKTYLSLLREFDNRFKYARTPNSGTYNARIAGIKRSIGKYVCFVDADDYLHCDALAVIVNELEQSGADILQFRICSNPEFQLDNATLFFGLEHTGEADVTDLRRLLLTSDKVNHVYTKAVRAEIAKSAQPYPERLVYGEDKLFCARLLERVDKAIYIDRVLYFYRLNPEGITKRGYSRRVVDNLLFVHESLRKYLAQWQLENIEATFDALLLSQCADQIARCCATSVGAASKEVRQLTSDGRFMRCVYSSSLSNLKLHRRVIVHLALNNAFSVLTVTSVVYKLVEDVLTHIRGR